MVEGSTELEGIPLILLGANFPAGIVFTFIRQFVFLSATKQKNYQVCLLLLYCLLGQTLWNRKIVKDTQEIARNPLRVILRHYVIIWKKLWVEIFYISNKCKTCRGQQKQNEFIAIIQMIPKVNIYMYPFHLYITTLNLTFKWLNVNIIDLCYD